MKRQRNMAQMKEQIKTPEKELNKREINNLSGAELKTLVIRMLKELSENLNSIKKIQLETNDTQTEIKSNLLGNNSRVDEAKNQINDLEHKETKKNQSEQEVKRIQKNKKSVSSLWDNFKCSNICIIGVPEGEKEELQVGNLFEKIMKENFPNLVKEVDMQVQEAQRVPNKMDAQRPTPSHIIIKRPKAEDKASLKSSKRKAVNYLQGNACKTVS